MKVLLTGATGAIGHHVLKKLVNTEYDVSVIQRDSKKNRKILKPYLDDITIFWGDITNKKLVESITKTQDVIIHLASLIPPYADNHPDQTKEVNYYGTKNIVDSVKKYNPGCFVIFASSISVYGDRIDNYNITTNNKCTPSIGDYYAEVKIETEKLIEKELENYTIFRLSAIFDLNKVDPLMYHMPLNTRMEIATAKDTAIAFVGAIEKTKELNKNIYNLGGGESCRIIYKDFLKECFKIYGLNYNFLDKKAFATQNFHCGYYADGDKLNDILNFRNDSIIDSIKYLENNVLPIKKLMAKIFSYSIVFNLNKSSDPRKALRKKDESMIKKFFKSNDK